MDAFFALFAVVALAFASTNLDNLLLLVGWQIAGTSSARRLFTGYVLGMLGVLIVAVLIGLVGYLFPIRYLGLLGIVPILLGVRLLIQNKRGGAGEINEALPAAAGILAIATVQLSNSVDTVLVFAPLLADSKLIFDAEIAALFLLLAVLWFGLARLLGERAIRSPVVGRMGHWLAPLVMIGVGVYILGNTATDMG